MKIHQCLVEPGDPRIPLDAIRVTLGGEPHLALAFGAPAVLESAGWHAALRTAFPQTRITGCSSAGDVAGRGVSDGSVVVTLLRFRDPDFRVASIPLSAMTDSRAAGAALGRELAPASPRHVVVFAQGVEVNGSELIAGLADVLGPDIGISGGMAGDGGAFRHTVVVTDDGVSSSRMVGIGLGGRAPEVDRASRGGWQPFGPARRVTRCEGNVLYSLDDVPALELYRRYLGEHARDLPASGLLFPFSMKDAERGDTGLIRTIIGIDEDQGSLVLAGDVAADGYLQLMHSSADRLIDGAEAAARQVRVDGAQGEERFALLVSCVGRRLVLGGRTDEEIESVAEVLGPDTVLAGFYSNGEIGPGQDGAGCRLHNQTMTLGLWRERA